MEIERLTLEPRRMVGLHDVVAVKDLPAFFARAWAATEAHLAGVGASPAGRPMALYRGQVTDTVDVVIGYAVGAGVPAGPDLEEVALPRGEAVATIHTGPFDTMEGTYRAVERYVADAGLTASAEVWEEYLVGPDTEADPARWQTRIVQPLG